MKPQNVTLKSHKPRHRFHRGYCSTGWSTGLWKFATNGGNSHHFYKHLNALKTARIESRDDSKRHSVAEIGKNGCFFVKRVVSENPKRIIADMKWIARTLILCAILVSFLKSHTERLRSSSTELVDTNENRSYSHFNQSLFRNMWCTARLCTENALKEEKQIRSQLMKRGSKEIGSEKVQYLKERLVELKFEKIYYSPPTVLQSQQLVVVTTSYGYPPHYSLDWINSQPWPVFISTKEKGFGIASEPWGNVGQEIASYMRFILMFWDYLPENVAFVHGHEKTWHQEGYKMSYMLRYICLQKFGYMSLNAYEDDAWMPKKGSISYYEIIKKYWKPVEFYLGPFPAGGFKEKCCAQFVVTRDRIRSRPLKLYEMILKQMIDKKKKYVRAKHGKNMGWDLIHFWESIWHFVFREPAIVNTQKKYGSGIDRNIETGSPLSKNPRRTLKNVISCPVSMRILPQ